jgi:hypothetical protein
MANLLMGPTVRVEPPAGFTTEPWLEYTSHNHVAFVLCPDQAGRLQPFVSRAFPSSDPALPSPGIILGIRGRDQACFPPFSSFIKIHVPTMM